MKRKSALVILSAFFAVLLALFSFSAWILGTARGARMLINLIAEATSLDISVDRVNGRLWGTMHLEGMRIAWPQGDLHAEMLVLRWQPLYLLSGNVVLTELNVKEIRIADRSPQADIDLAWPEITGLPARLDGWIDSLTVQGLSYRKGDDEPLEFSTISSMVLWNSRRLTIKDARIEGDSVNVKGTIAAGFDKPFLYADVMLIPGQPVRSMDRFFIKASLQTGRDPVQIQGPVRITGQKGDEEQVSFAAEMRLKRDAIEAEQIVLTEAARRGTLTGECTIDFHTDKPEFTAFLQAVNMDLSPEIGIETHLSGSISFRGSPDKYAGTFDVSNSGNAWRYAQLEGSFSGDTGGIQLLVNRGAWLRGTLQGKVDSSWIEGISVSADMKARNIDPAAVTDEWVGSINADLSGKLTWPDGESFEGEVSGALHDSMLRGRVLRGEVRARLHGDDLIIKKMFLRGKGFDIDIEGQLRKRLTFLADITDLSGLVPESRGRLHAEGWFSMKDRLRGSATVKGRGLSLHDAGIGSVRLHADFFTVQKERINLQADAKKLEYKSALIDEARIELRGSAERHVMAVSAGYLGSVIRGKMAGTYKQNSWEGTITELSGWDAGGPWRLDNPAKVYISASQISIPEFSMTGNRDEWLTASIDLIMNPLKGFVSAEWEEINLSRAHHWFQDMSLSGRTSGKIRTKWADNDLQFISGVAKASGTVLRNKQRIDVKQTNFRIEWDDKSLGACFNLQLTDRGTIGGEVTARGPAHLRLPESGQLEIRFSQFNADIIQTWLPESIKLNGEISAHVAGTFLPGRRFDVSGNAGISAGSMRLTTEKGGFNLALRTVETSFSWRNEELRGHLELSLADYGGIRGEFALPIAARFPVKADRDGKIQASLEGSVREKGLLTSFFPGLVQESRGNFDLNIGVKGTWENPVYSGSAVLTDAGAYLPSTGINMKDVRAKAHFEGDKIIVRQFSARSGKGVLNAEAEIKVENWQIKGYKGTIKGDHFQAVYLPDLQLLASPNLTFTGKPGTLSLKGEISVPELFVSETETELVKPSEDVIITDEPAKPERRLPDIEIAVNIVLGKRSFIRMEGIDAQIDGQVELSATNLDEISGKGAIRVVKGAYRKYGIDLDIKRGRAVFAAVPVDNPTLDILAVRQVGDVAAGVIVRGTARAPVVNLYSEPPMADTDVLAYIVLGHPLGADRAHVGELTRAAGFLLSKGESATLQAKLQRSLGVDVLEIEAGGSDVVQSALTIGKYLSPRLFISYGISLFTGEDVFRFRYKLSRHWQVQTESSVETGIDLFYTIEFR